MDGLDRAVYRVSGGHRLWLIAIFGEERTVTFITNHPYLFMCCVLVFTACTGGVGYWCYSRDTDDLHAAYRSRLAKHSQLFKVA